MDISITFLGSRAQCAPPCQEDNPPQTGPKMSIGKIGEGRHITVNGIRLTDIQKNRKFGNEEHTSTTKKKKRNN